MCLHQYILGYQYKYIINAFMIINLSNIVYFTNKLQHLVRTDVDIENIYFTYQLKLIEIQHNIRFGAATISTGAENYALAVERLLKWRSS